MVVQRGTNDHEILPMARHFRGTGIVLRFIEYMDVGATNGWKMDEVLPSAEVVRRLHEVFPLEALDATAPGETAERWAYRDGAGEIGVISSVTQAFCGTCNRARLSTEGQLYPACSPPRATTCAACCAAAPPMRTSRPPSATSGRAAPTAIPNCAGSCRPTPAAASAASR
jgi:molybdenum cofactor biosynthesis enzyme MoaA